MSPVDNSTIPVVTCPRHIGHRPAVEVQCGRPIPAFDTVARMAVVEQALAAHPRVLMTPPSVLTAVAETIGRVHDDDLVDFLQRAWRDRRAPDDEIDLIFADTFLHPGLHAPGAAPKKSDQGGAFGQYCFDTITGIGPDSFDAAMGSVVTALTAAGHTAAGSALSIALCRPPGHHVSRNAFGGGCYLNNAAITAQWLRDHDVDRVAVVDVDFHHGNGTQAIFYDRDDVLYTSLHGHPDRCYPYFTGHADEIGTGAGRGATLNVPVPADVEGPAYLGLLDQALTAADAHAPDVVMVSLGFDTYRADPAGDALLETRDYFAMGRAFRELGRPLLAILEGGYAVTDLGANIRAWLRGAAGNEFDD